MSWPRRDEQCRLYLERKDKSYVLVIAANGRNDGTWDAIVNVYAGSSPSLCTSAVSDEYLYHRCKRVEWRDLPSEWKKAFLPYVRSWDLSPQQIRGFWRMRKKVIG